MGLTATSSRSNVAVSGSAAPHGVSTLRRSPQLRANRSVTLGASNRVRVAGGAQGVDPNSLSPRSAAAAEAKTAQRMRSRQVTSQTVAKAANVTIDVRWHVITQADGSGAVSRAQLRRQLAVLNDAFAGRRPAAGSAETLFRFQTKSIDYTETTTGTTGRNPRSTPATTKRPRRPCTGVASTISISTSRAWATACSATRRSPSTTAATTQGTT